VERGIDIKSYQQVVIDGKKTTPKRPGQDNSKFWNEGKWKTFIEPHIPFDCVGRTFVEIGCNAGLFLKLAKNKGFRHVVGLEPDSNNFRNAKKYRMEEDYTLLKKRVTMDFDPLIVPCASLTLMSCSHYHMKDHAWVKYLDALARRTAYCLIVSVNRPQPHRRHRALRDIDSVRKYFNDWDEVSVIENVDPTGDPDPSPDMFSILFKSRKSIDVRTDVWNKKLWVDEAKERYQKALAGFVRDVMSGKDYVKTELFRYLAGDYQKLRGKVTRHSDKLHNIDKLKQKRKLIFDIAENGIIEPLLINNGVFIDGRHRVCIAKELGYDYILARVI
jgi:hypothetical protein